MRGYGFFAILSALLIVFFYLVLTKDRAPHLMPKPAPAASAGPADAGAEGGSIASLEAGAPADANAPKQETAVAPLGRPLRVSVLGWEQLSPGFGGDAGVASMRGQPVDVTVAESLGALESKLAKGGTDAAGADIAVLPLPAFVASYERLRALDPRAFLVTGWSVGREELRGGKDATIARPMEGAEVKLVTAGGDSATWLALFALDRAGTAPGRVKLVATGANDVKASPFAAAMKGDSVDGDRKLLVNTAEARRLVPIVAIATAGSLDANLAVYKTWAQAWLEGSDRVRADAPSAARQIAAMQGAPEALVLLERWGQLERASLADNALRMGLRGSIPVTVETLFSRTWSVFRASGLLASPPPDKAPVSTAVVAALAGTDVPEAGVAPSGGKAATGAVLLVHREPDSADAASVAAEAAFLADVFERATVRVTAKGDKAAKAVVEAVADKSPSVAPRVVAGQGAPATGGYALEILAAP